jgi:alpha-glucosidase
MLQVRRLAKKEDPMSQVLKSSFKQLMLALMAGIVTQPVMAGVERRVFTDQAKNQVIKLEWLHDGVLHFEFTQGIERKSKDPIYLSPLIKPQEFSGPSRFDSRGETFTTREMKVVYEHGCFTATDLAAKKQIARVCAVDTNRDWKRLELQTVGVRNAYGLGQVFGAPGDMSADRNGKVTATKGAYGNGMPAYAGGATGEALFPVLMAMGSGEDTWGFVLDNLYKQNWDLSHPTWRVSMFGDQIRGFIITGGSPQKVRQRFMDLSGRAPVPPRKMFGFWMSEYGYDHWDEVQSRLGSMRRDGFPIDGFFLDLQWFGNVAPGSDHTRMGTLQFDERNFPNPEETIQRLKTAEDIGLVTIEESYIGRALPEHDDLESKGFLAHECGHPRTASYLTGDVTGNSSEWWGRGGMIDWSNPEAGRYWHNTKRQALVRMGVFAHWLDLGEPEMFDPSSCYFGSGEPGLTKHQDIHNIFSLLWTKSLWDGFAENNVRHRPFSMLRSGNIGLQRYGAGMWSGDIGGNLPSLAAHIASHNQVSWSGIDYYSSDIGGFHRNRADGKPLSHNETQESFTQWFANATWFDIPVRSHVMNLDNNRDTAPNTIGHVESNRVNLLTRYSLTPYYYSLAHNAANDGLPVMEPMPMRFPSDMNVRAMGSQRMLGQLMMAAAAETGVYQRDVYLPKGLWYDFFDGDHKKSTGQNLIGYPLYRDGLFRLPVFAQGGAIIPRYAGHMGRHGLGGGKIETVAKTMLLDVFVNDAPTASEFVMTEDDGYSRQTGSQAMRVTRFEQKTETMLTTLSIQGAVGRYDGAVDDRAWTARVWSPGWQVAQVSVDGSSVNKCQDGFTNRSTACFKLHGSSAVLVELPAEDIRRNRQVTVRWEIGSARTAAVNFICDEGRDAPRGHGMFVSGDHSALGSWDPNKAIPLKPSEFARGIWTRVINGLTPGQTVSWKCLRKLPGGGDSNLEWQRGPNNQFDVNSDGGFSGMARVRWQDLQ